MSKKPNPVLIDDENPEWTNEMFKQSVRFDALPVSLQAKLRGRPKAAVTKERITIRLSPDVVTGGKRASMPRCETGSKPILRRSSSCRSLTLTSSPRRREAG